MLFKTAINLFILTGLFMFIASASSVLYPPICVGFFYAGLVTGGTGLLVVILDLIIPNEKVHKDNK